MLRINHHFWHTTMKLNDTKIKALKAKSKRYHLSDGNGLYLTINPNANKVWGFRYQFNKSNHWLGLGVYPNVSLKKAREMAQEYQHIRANGQNPITYKRDIQVQEKLNKDNSFKTVALEWFNAKSPEWSKNHTKRNIGILERSLFPFLKNRLITDVTPLEMIDVLKKLEHKGQLSTLEKARQIGNQLFKYAIIMGKCENNPCANISGAFRSPRAKNYAHFNKPDDIAKLLKHIDRYHGYYQTKMALIIAPHVFLRPKELVNSEWSYIDFNKRLWRIPAALMKKNRDHLVPMSDQVYNYLQELYKYTGQTLFLFPAIQTDSKPLNSESLRRALRIMGYTNEEITTHGLRHMASTLLHEMASEKGFTSEMIELQLSHQEKNQIKATYNHAEYLKERTRMMQIWSDYLDQLKYGTNVIPIEQQKQEA